MFRLTSIILVLLSLSVEAGCNSKSCSSTIKRVYVTGASDGRIYIEPSDNANGIVNCTLAENRFFTLRRSHQQFDEMYSLFLASRISNQEVTIRISEGTNGCAINYVWL